MKLTISAGLILLFFLLLVSIFSEGEKFKTYDSPEAKGYVKVAFIGNSITFHPVKDEVGWKNANGMAASNVKNDYAHRLLQSIIIDEKDSYIRNFYPFETDNSVADDHIKSLGKLFRMKPKIIIFQLGDNVDVRYRNPIGSMEHILNFRKNYKHLVFAAKSDSTKIYCLSTWWEQKIVDYVIKEQCLDVGGKYVYIGDIYKDKNNTDRKVVDYKNDGVDRHPKDYGMNQIGRRLEAAIRSN